jgi:hypothetical protein
MPFVQQLRNRLEPASKLRAIRAADIEEIKAEYAPSLTAKLGSASFPVPPAPANKLFLSCSADGGDRRQRHRQQHRRNATGWNFFQRPLKVVPPEHFPKPARTSESFSKTNKPRRAEA